MDLINQAETVYERLETLACARSECAHRARNLQTPIKCVLQIAERDGWDEGLRSQLRQAVRNAWDYLYGV